MGGQSLLLLIGLKILIIMTSLQNIVILGAQGLLIDEIKIFNKDDQAAKHCSFILMFLRPGNLYAKQKHLGCKKGEANQKQQLSDYKSIHSYTCD